MKPQKPLFRFLLGAGIVLVFLIAGFAWVGAAIPSWGATRAEIDAALPGDANIPHPDLIWNHAITIRATPEQIYPWLVQIGDTRGGYYSYSFIENLFMLASGASGRYVNATQVHPEWQTPAKGQEGIIVDYMVIKDYLANQWVLAVPTDKLPLGWTWLWYLQPVDQNTTRLIVRHRITYPEGAPAGMITAVFDAGYVMERGMLLGIRDHAEGSIPSPLAEPLGIIVWLAVLGCGIAAAVRFVRVPDGYHALGVGLEVIAILFIITFIQPPLWARFILLIMALAGVAVAFSRPAARAVLRKVGGL